MCQRSSKSIAVLFALLSTAPLGCQSRNLSAAALPPELLAPAGAGKQQIELRGMALATGTSSAVGPADLIEVTLLTGLADDSVEAQSVRVGDNGVVEIPYVGPVMVAGLDPTDVAERIKRAAIERGIYLQPQVHVRIEEQATYRVTVLGAVSEPGVQEVPRRGCDILSAIAAAGGFTENAGTVVEVLRHDAADSYAGVEAVPADGEVTQVAFNPPISPGSPALRAEEINLANLSTLGPDRQNLSDRDVVVVRPRQKRVVHVSGLVNNPDQFELTQDHDLRLLDAIAMAGGESSSVADKVLVIRRSPGRSEPAVIGVSLASAKRGGPDNLVLQSGDLISVETTIATTAVEAVNTFFRISLGLGGNLSLF